VAQLRDQTPAIRARGADLAAVGNGTPDQADHLARALGTDFPLLTDPDRRTFAALGARRSPGGVLHPRVLASAARAWRAGHRQHGVQGDAMQLGGVVVIHPGDEVAGVWRSAHAGDHPAAEQILAVL
jgi:peroxiredoxin